MYISVGHQADEQLEALNFLLSQEAFKQGSGDSPQGFEQRSGQLSSNGFQQKLQNSESNQVSSAIEIRPDSQREQRKGVPEVVFGETKETGQIITMARNILAESGRVIISRVRTEAIEALRESFQTYTMRIREAARAVVIYRPDYVRRSTGGYVGVISAGTSDIPVAEEAALIAEEMGCEVTCIYDVGVAGLHRLLGPLRDLLSKEVDAIIVAAGMDGALPSVVAGLVPVPVIGLPTSVGYGMGGKGVAALLSMLQTCAPGLSVVNIDNGVGAGITAAMIANGVARARKRQS
jgi:pyridinium-3,5-biscarboxylic acid mononucleotide synthase